MPSKEVITFWLDMGPPISLPSRIVATAPDKVLTAGQAVRAVPRTVTAVKAAGAHDGAHKSGGCAAIR
jgi:hypothetical protein